jgi:hypothetical protein
MTEGFIASEKYNMPTVAKWVSGAPRKGWWGDVKTPGKPLEIATWRCGRCGFLENYAH